MDSDDRPKISLGNYKLHMPRSRKGRIALGTSLVAGGMLGFLPVLGFWMVPLGVMVLSNDVHLVRRLRRKTVVWWQRRKETEG